MSHADSFEAFRARYKPLIRPEETYARMRRAMSVDAEFLAEFGVLRSYLRPLLEGWSDGLLGYLKRFSEFSDQFSHADEIILQRLMREHAKHLAAGHFDERYLDSLEDVALFFIYFDVKSIWVAGAFQAITGDAIDFVFKRAEARHAIRVRQLVKALSKTLALELNQIQRVYTIYERRQYRTLIEDLRTGAFLEHTGEGGALGLDIDLPALDPTSVMRVRDSYAGLSSQSGLLAKAFAADWLKRAPEHRDLVRADGQEAETVARAFAGTLAELIADLDRPEQLAQRVRALGGAAVARGATAAQAETTLAALIATLSHASGTRWRSEDAAAWRHVFQTLATAAFASADPTALREAREQALETV